ncbi:hypothetical protein ASE90_01650 [Sphingomonas sp. Leaf67]|uniref:hypothetical protein n=1 Tax=Sphingomonas sp. Leaf67 TaxID=1736230 RepID=UPI0006FC2DE1|nr:hypothetical protein [Sphingomonas sp. Leaf67]KQN91537.1 hypothetical protein ASE90_01650 [Sphingomonas sp. Leaf67]
MRKIAFPARLFAALLMLCACVLPPAALAQTGTGSIVTIPTRIPDTNADGLIKLDGWALKVSPKLPRKTTVYGPCPGLPDFSYRVRQACEAVTVPPVTVEPPIVEPEKPLVAPAPAYTVVTSGKERILLGTDIVVGLNEWGGIGTGYNAPKGVDTAASYGFLRVGIYRPSTNLEVSLNGRAIEGFNVGYTFNGARVRYSNQWLTGYYQIPGAFDAGTRWTGVTPTGLAIIQDAELIGSTLRFTAKLTNTTGSVMTGLRYMRTADFDTNNINNSFSQKDSFATDNRIVTRGTVSAGLRGFGKGATAILSSPEASAVATFFGFVNTDPFVAAAYDSPQAVGSTATSDATSNVLIDKGTLLPGASTTVVTEIGLM